jgi:hypothetical protein
MSDYTAYSAPADLFPQNVIERFHRSYDAEAATGCWIWRLARHHTGYGHFKLQGKSWRAHRISWMLANDRSIPVGQHVCHTCDNPSCVNPAHLFLGSDLDNAQDRDRKGRHGSWSKPETRPRGEGHCWSRLTEDDVRSIRIRYERGDSQRSMAKEYGVGETTIYDVVHRRSWIHVV